jgi:sodium-dependent phosphate cotransporter
LENNPGIAVSKPKVWNSVRIILLILGTLLLFLFAVDLMIASLQQLSRAVVETIFEATANPFTGLFMGLLLTAMIQSSSTTMAFVVALMASGSITLQSAIPIIMGANVGTTITSVVVSLGFIRKRKEFRRAVAAGAYHCFFNILTVLILFPLEYQYGFLTNTTSWITGHFFHVSQTYLALDARAIPDSFNPLIRVFVDILPNGYVLIALSFVLLFTSILLFRKLLSDLLNAGSPEAFGRFFFKGPLKSFMWGVLTTAAIRSSTITTSVVVPIVAKKIASLRQAAPFIMGANIGTTITAFIAAMLNENAASAVSIGIAHFLFNAFGVLTFFPIPALRRFPIALSSAFARLTMKYRVAGFVFLLLIFFLIPFTLILINR